MPDQKKTVWSVGHVGKNKKGDDTCWGWETDRKGDNIGVKIGQLLVTKVLELWVVPVRPRQKRQEWILALKFLSNTSWKFLGWSFLSSLNSFESLIYLSPCYVRLALMCELKTFRSWFFSLKQHFLIGFDVSNEV